MSGASQKRLAGLGMVAPYAGLAEPLS